MDRMDRRIIFIALSVYVNLEMLNSSAQHSLGGLRLLKSRNISRIVSSGNGLVY